MSTTLPARASALRARLSRLHEMSSNVAEAADLEGLRGQLARHVEKFSGSAEKRRLLTKAGITIVDPPSGAVVRKKATTVLERFAVTPKSATLKRGQAWPTMLEEIDSAARDLQAAVTAAWKAERTSLFSGDTPAAIESKLAKTKPNQEALKVYQGLYSQFKALFDSLPPDQATIERARTLGSQLEGVAKAFDFHVAPEVKAFLEAVQSVLGAPISLLTDEVLAWLRENESLDAYRVKSSDRA
ncbi:hypothetical protein [Mesorhizobium sp. B2-8-5]|uniref:hypothetical protein n=1 Tax=Mesorhizobium sp. B2-8-5 TaxID=2589903 RepID=UPI0011288CB5|nr:hypothetical protein [Mesorhizobium sp. B2-8-5]UCI23525.1 hypothetical protein FJ430_18065 [Mesorhizobium sp. B2-8-5]